MCGETSTAEEVPTEKSSHSHSTLCTIIDMAKSSVALADSSSNGVVTAAAAGKSNGVASTVVEQGFWKRALLLIGCSLGIYATFLLYGILQERMYVGEAREARTAHPASSRRHADLEFLCRTLSTLFLLTGTRTSTARSDRNSTSHYS